MQEPLLTVIVPVYNVEAYLPRCLDSLLGQTYRNLEIICVNDGSTAILDGYVAKDARIKVFHQQNGGLSAARNTGLDHASGEWIAGLSALGMALFAGWLSLVSPKLSRSAGFLAVCGGPALFYIYMLHMIPLMLGQQFGLSAYGEWYLVVSLLVTALLTYVALQVDKLICRK